MLPETPPDTSFKLQNITSKQRFRIHHQRTPRLVKTRTEPQGRTLSVEILATLLLGAHPRRQGASELGCRAAPRGAQDRMREAEPTSCSPSASSAQRTGGVTSRSRVGHGPHGWCRARGPGPGKDGALSRCRPFSRCPPHPRRPSAGRGPKVTVRDPSHRWPSGHVEWGVKDQCGKAAPTGQLEDTRCRTRVSEASAGHRLSLRDFLWEHRNPRTLVTPPLCHSHLEGQSTGQLLTALGACATS